MLRSLKDILKHFLLRAPAAITTGGTIATSGVDCSLGGSVSFLVTVGANTGTALAAGHKVDLIVQHADVDVAGSYANCVDADIYNAEDGANGNAKALDAPADASAIWPVHYRGNKKFARLNLVVTGTPNMPLGVSAIVGHTKFNPAL